MAYANLEGLGWLAEDMQSWTATHYEPKLRFDPTPVYSVTLAEDVVATAANPYRIELPPGISLCCSFFKLSAFSANGTGYVQTNDDASNFSYVRGSTLFGTSARDIICWHTVKNGMNVTVLGVGTSAGMTSALYETISSPAIGGNTITSIDYYTEDNAPAIPAGSQFIVYAAKEI